MNKQDTDSAICSRDSLSIKTTPKSQEMSLNTVKSPKLAKSIRAGLSTKILPGDWICSQCQLNNFAARVKCIQCGASHAGAIRPVDRVGDWSCPNDNCRFHNFASRKECHRCGTKKLEVRKGPSVKHAELKAGDWICQGANCGAHNFAKRDTCFQCGAIADLGKQAISPVKRTDSKAVFLEYGESFFSQNPFASYGFGYQA
jgi:hypothetical protein